MTRKKCTEKRDAFAKLLFFLVNYCFLTFSLPSPPSLLSFLIGKPKRKIGLTFAFVRSLLFFVFMRPWIEQLCVHFLKSVTSKLTHILIFYIFFCRKSNKLNSISLLEKLYWLPLGELNWLTFRQDKRKLHVLDSLSPSLKNLLGPSLPVRTGGRWNADVITNFFRIDRFPFSIA